MSLDFFLLPHRQQHKEERTRTRRKRKKHERRHFVSKEKQQEWAAIPTQSDVARFQHDDDDDSYDHPVPSGDSDEETPPKVSGLLPCCVDMLLPLLTLFASGFQWSPVDILLTSC